MENTSTNVNNQIKQQIKLLFPVYKKLIFENLTKYN